MHSRRAAPIPGKKILPKGAAVRRRPENKAMKKLLIPFLLLLGLAVCRSESVTPGPEALAAQAIPLMEIWCGCPDAYSFTGSPEPQAVCEAVLAYRARFPESPMTDAEICACLFCFSDGTPAEFPADFPADTPLPLPCRVTPEAVLTLTDGQIKVSVRAEIDYGIGFELGFYADLYLLTDPEAPFGARLTGMFLPE